MIPIPAPLPNPFGLLFYLLKRKLGMIPPDAMPPAPPRSAGGNLTLTADLFDPETGEKKGTSHAFLLIVTDGRSAFIPGDTPPFFGDLKRKKPPEQVAWASWQQTLRF